MRGTLSCIKKHEKKEILCGSYDQTTSRPTLCHCRSGVGVPPPGVPPPPTTFIYYVFFLVKRKVIKNQINVIRNLS